MGSPKFNWLLGVPDIWLIPKYLVCVRRNSLSHSLALMSLSYCSWRRCKPSLSLAPEVELELKKGPENAVVLNNTIMRERRTTDGGLCLCVGRWFTKEDDFEFRPWRLRSGRGRIRVGLHFASGCRLFRGDETGISIPEPRYKHFSFPSLGLSREWAKPELGWASEPRRWADGEQGKAVGQIGKNSKMF
jgi:hypothetical protein